MPYFPNNKDNTNYTAVGDIATVTDHRGVMTTAVYDIRRILKALQTPLGVAGNDVEYEYDDDARLRFTKIATGDAGDPWYISEQKYDIIGRPIESVNNAGNKVFYAYDIINRINTVTVEASATETRVAQSYYNAVGQVTKTVQAPGTASEITELMAYTLNGAIDWVKDGKGNQTSYGYDDFGRPLLTTFPDLTVEGVIEYDTLGRAVKSRDRKGTVFTASYSILSQLISRGIEGDGSYTTSYNYDIMGRARTVTKGFDTVTRAYDRLGRLFRETGVHGKYTEYSYDIPNARNTISYYDGGTDSYSATYNYDDLGRLFKVTENRNSVLKDLATYVCDGLSRRTSLTYGNNKTVTYIYEADSTLKRITNAIGAGTVSHDYGYNKIGQVTSKIVTPATYEWTPYTLVSDTATVNVMNQIINLGNTSISYDGNGNLLTAGIDTLEWNKENRLTKVTRSGSVIGEYSYDPVGRRSSKTANQTSVTRFIMAGGNVMAELDGSGALLRRYVYGPGTDQPIAMIMPDGAHEYYHYDGKGTVIATTDDSGALVASYIYDPYGKSDDLTGNPYRFKGRRLDFETGFYYNRARYYSPSLGRFLNADPIGYGDGLNMYAYAGNDPVNASDPSGLKKDNDNDSQILEEVVSIGSRIPGGGTSGSFTGSSLMNSPGMDAINHYDKGGIAGKPGIPGIRINSGQNQEEEGDDDFITPSSVEVFLGADGMVNVKFTVPWPSGYLSPSTYALWVATVGRNSSGRNVSGYGFFRPDGHPFAVGRDTSDIIWSGEVGPGVGSFIDNYVPFGHTFGTNHDALVGYLTNNGFPDWMVNIPTMPWVFIYSTGQEMANYPTTIRNWIFEKDIAAPFSHTHPEE